MPPGQLASSGDSATNSATSIANMSPTCAGTSRSTSTPACGAPSETTAAHVNSIARSTLRRSTFLALSAPKQPQPASGLCTRSSPTTQVAAANATVVASRTDR